MDPDGPKQNVHQYLLASASLFPARHICAGTQSHGSHAYFYKDSVWNNSTALMCTASKRAVDAAVAVDRRTCVFERSPMVGEAGCLELVSSSPFKMFLFSKHK